LRLDLLRRDIINEIKQTVGESIAEAVKEAFVKNCKGCQAGTAMGQDKGLEFF
jgi:hypothetical protein